MIKIYRKTATIKAEQFDGSDEMIEKYSMIPPTRLEPEYTIQTSDGHWVLEVGNWIINEAGDIKAVADEEFKKTYAELPVIPDYVAEYIETAKNNADVVKAGIAAVEYGGGDIELSAWIEWNGDTFARAWLDGYQTEEDE